MTLIHRPDMSLDLARRLLAELESEAQAAGVSLAGVVVDRAGCPVAAIRMDGAQLGAVPLATDKAYTAVAFGHPTSRWAQASAPGGPDWGLGATLGGRAVVFPGGCPVYADGALVGALGVSGAASTVDERCAEKAIAATGLAGAP